MSSDSQRLDTWLWAARFFKTRGLAKQAIEGGKVDVNGDRAKPAKAVRAGDQLAISKAGQRFVVDVQGVSEKRGPAKVAEALYAETEASRQAREEAVAIRRVERASQPIPEHRPDKHDRRRLARIKRGD
jgi:ribosome-associated heat shock protein Hsp15